MKIGDLVKTKKEGIIGVIIGEIKRTGDGVGFRGDGISYGGDVFVVAIVPTSPNEKGWREMGWKHDAWDFYPSQLELLQ